MTSRSDLPATVVPGEVLAGKYRIERVLGVGGMGVVVAAHHLQLDERVALKFLHPLALDGESWARFLREARAAVKIRSEHVARVMDVGQLESGAPYMVMEYLEGVDLASWLQERGPLPVDQAVDFVLQACEAMADAHVLGIVHRDLKPANLFCIQRTDGELSIKVLDFGISKITTPGVSGHGMTSTRLLMGSPNYMSPEQMQKSKGVDARTDIWSLGIVLHELLTGRPPFDADAVTELAIMVANDPAPSLRASRSDAPAGLEQVVSTCLAKERSQRFQSVGELALALKDYGSRRSFLSVERVLGTLRKAGLSATGQPPAGDVAVLSPSASSPVLPTNVVPTAATWQTAAETNSRRRAFTGIAFAAALLAVVAAGALLQRKPWGASPTSTDSAASASQPLAPSREASPAEAPPAPDRPAVAPATAASPPVAPSTTITRAAERTAPRHPVNPAAVAPQPKPNCDPSYVVDSDGLRHYKPECL